ncbi:MAG TPA: DEAD/DEAH box helicase [Baekduia sp.]|nr:DEAD/DEAH box helicase [Baekduia sp.]
MELASPAVNVELRELGARGNFVVFAFPYDAGLVAEVKEIPGRRFDWPRREWSAPVEDWVGVHVAAIVERHPELTVADEVSAWLASIDARWFARVGALRHDGRGWWAIETLTGSPPVAFADAQEHGGLLLAPFTAAAAEELDATNGVRLSSGAQLCVESVQRGEAPPPARLRSKVGVSGTRLVLDVLWDDDIGRAFDKLSGVTARSLPVDPWHAERLDEFIATHDVAVDAMAAPVLTELRRQADEATEQVRDSRATSGAEIEEVATVLGGELQPFQWAGVRYALRARQLFIADEQGLGKTVEALATLEADDAYPAIVVCPASLKLNWERETARWLPHRDVAVVAPGMAVPPAADIVVINYELVSRHEGALKRIHAKALVVDESHYCKNPRAKRTQAVRRVAQDMRPTALKLALTGTPVLNHADELISQLRVIGRLGDFGSGARFSKQFEGEDLEERVHWHLRRRCFVRRLKKDVLPQLPAKRQVVVPISLSNEPEYRLAEKDVIAWLREQPLDLKELNAKIAATLRAQRLAQLGTLQRLAAAGKLHSALAWIHDFLASGEPLVVFARHVDIQNAVVERFPDALHLLGADNVQRREAAVNAFQQPDGPQLIVCATRVAAQGITLTRASNVAFLELEWTPALHDQAEDRCHRIGQEDAVTAWYLLAADTIDETMAKLIQSKRATVGAVTDGRRLSGDGMVEQVIRELRDGQPFRHLHVAATR